jgi:hypothetical protein
LCAINQKNVNYAAMTNFLVIAHCHDIFRGWRGLQATVALPERAELHKQVVGSLGG